MVLLIAAGALVLLGVIAVLLALLTITLQSLRVELAVLRGASPAPKARPAGDIAKESFHAVGSSTAETIPQTTVADWEAEQEARRLEHWQAFANGEIAFPPQDIE